MAIHVEELKQAFITIESKYHIGLKTDPTKTLAILTDVAPDWSLSSDRGFLSEMQRLGIFQVLNAADGTSNAQKQEAISKAYSKLTGDYKSENASKEFLNLIIDVYGWNVAKYIVDEDPTPVIEEPTPLNPQPVSPNPGHSWNTNTYSGYQSSQMLPPDFEAKKEEAITAYSSELYDMAYRGLYDLKDFGDPDIEVYLGYCFAEGRGTAQSYSMAALYYKRAADKGHPSGLLSYGYLLSQGLGVKEDFQAAFEYFIKAAEQESDNEATMADIAIARRNVAICYRDGIGVSENLSESLLWYKKAANAGDGESAETLGDLYFEGQSVPQDYKEAYEWYSQAMVAGNYTNRYAYMLEYGLGTEPDLTTAAGFYLLAAGQGDQWAQCNCARNFRYGHGIEKDYNKSFYWYSQSAQQGNAQAQEGLADCFYYGYGTAVDYQKAFYWYGLAAEAGRDSAQNSYGYMNAVGEGCVVNTNEAFYWYEKAAKQGNYVAQSNVGLYYKNGTVVAQDYEKSFEWFTKSAEQGYPTAMHWLGWLYFNGKGAPRDHEKAYYWMRKASDAGNDGAKQFLDENKTWAWRYAKTYNPNGTGDNITTTGVY